MENLLKNFFSKKEQKEKPTPTNVQKQQDKTGLGQFYDGPSYCDNIMVNM